MKKNMIGFMTVCLLSALIPFPAYSQTPDSDNNTETTDSIGNMTAEEYMAYVDSIYYATHPQAIAVYAEASDTTADSTRVTTTYVLPDNPHVPHSITIDQTMMVGEIPIESGTSPTGARTYNVPINCFKSEGITAPQISLSYNSQQGNGILGMGWSVGGLQAITRSNKSIYYDNATSGIALTKDDAFYLNGTRLIKTSANSTEIQYETETGHIKVVGHLNGTVLKYFDVYFPNGYRGVFGFTTNTASKLTYPVTSLTDDKGNTITYTYNNYSNIYSINRITYGSAYIQFAYNTSRTDIIKSYRAGLEMTENHRLTSVACYLGNTVQNVYTLNYTTQDRMSVLTQIDYMEANSSPNSLKFYYGTNASSTFNSNTTTLNGGYYNFTDPNAVDAVRGRFDYDLSDDGVILYPFKETYHRIYDPYQNINRFKNYYDDNTNAQIYLYTGLNGSLATPTPNLTVGQGFIRMLCTDLKGLQEEFPIKVNNYVDGTTDKLTFAIYRKNVLGGGVSHQYTRTFNYTTVHTDGSGYKSVVPKFYYTGDFNGDGKMEVMAVTVNNPLGRTDWPTRCIIYDLENNNTLMNSTSFVFNDGYTGSGNLDRIQVLDYNGDGKTDLCLINSTGTFFYSFTQSGSNITCHLDYTNTSFTKSNLENRYHLWGDFNGDGLVDMMLSPPSTNNHDWLWTTYINKGDGTFSTTTFNGPSNSGSRFLIHDFDCDGTSDLVSYSDSAMSVYRIWNGKRTERLNFFMSESNPKLIPISLSASTTSSTLFSVKGNDGRKIDYARNLRTELLATGMANSLGVIERNDYLLLPQAKNNGVYTMGSSAIFPYVNISEPLAVLTGDEKYLGGSKFDYNNFHYTNAVFHRHGLGFCGFDEIQGTNKKGLIQTTTFNPYAFGNVASVSSLMQNTSYTYNTTAQNNKIRKNNVTQKVETDLLKNVTWTTNYTYDTYDNMLTSTSSSGGYQISKQNTYTNLTTLSTRYQLGIVNSQTETITKGGMTDRRGMSVQARNSNYLPTLITKTTLGPQAGKIIRSYDSQGRVISEGIIKYTSTDTLTTTNTYNTNGLLTSTTDPMGRSTTFSYDARGRMTTRTDNTGTTTYTYDNLGRVLTETYPDGSTKQNTYAWASPCYTVTVTGSNAPTTTTYYDARNRETRSSQKLYNGTLVKTDRQYDTYGLLQKVSVPFTGTSASKWTTYSYDFFNRTEMIVEPTGRTINYSYSGNTVTEDNGQNTTTKTYDAMSRLIEVEDNSGTTSYTLHPNGNPLEIDALGNSVTFTYDIYGRRTSMNDPSHGTTTYQYDTAGNTSKITDANGNETQMTYDKYGRMTSKQNGDFTTTYTYNNTLDKLTSVSSTNGTAKTFTYDSYGRLTVSKENATSSIWFQQTHSYDTAGRLASTAYVSNRGTLGTENFTYQNNNVYEVRWDTTSIFRMDGVGNIGYPSSVYTGPLHRTYGYSSAGQPTSRVVLNGSTQVMNQTYAYHSTTGNLITRRDVLANKTENFTYDSLDRLTQYGTSTVTYDDYGNITAKSDIGSYAYNNSDKPFAVTDVALSNNTLSSLGTQTVTNTSFNRPASVTTGDYMASFTYNDSYQRVKMVLTLDQHVPFNRDAENDRFGAILMNRYYLGGRYEYETSSNGMSCTERLYLNGDYYGGSAVFVKETSNITNPPHTSKALYYVCRDHLGSITHIFKSDGTLQQQLSYDAWGRLRNPQTHALYAPGSEPTLFLGRGYCGHEHMQEMGLINMNARLYDPYLGRFLSPDPYVQLPDFSQNFNRYSYCLNNPLNCNDLSGEWFGLDDLLVSAVGFVVGYISNGISTGNWGWSSVQSGLGSALGSWIGYNTAGLSNLGQYIAQSSANTVINTFIPSINVPIGNHFGLSISPALGLGPGGLSAGLNISGQYHNGDFSLGGSYGFSSNYSGWYGQFGIGRFNIGYGRTNYGSTNVYGEPIGSQTIGTIKVGYGDVSFALSNDYLGEKHQDRWRTSAAELSIGNFTIGTYVVTNDGKAANEPIGHDPSLLLGENKNFGAHTHGEVFSAPLWVGYKYNNQICRIGVGHPYVQDLTQNAVHHYLKPVGAPDYVHYNFFKGGPYSYFGYNNPISLWNY